MHFVLTNDWCPMDVYPSRSNLYPTNAGLPFFISTNQPIFWPRFCPFSSAHAKCRVKCVILWLSFVIGLNDTTSRLNNCPICHNHPRISCFPPFFKSVKITQSFVCDRTICMCLLVLLTRHQFNGWG